MNKNHTYISSNLHTNKSKNLLFIKTSQKIELCPIWNKYFINHVNDYINGPWIDYEPQKSNINMTNASTSPYIIPAVSPLVLSNNNSYSQMQNPQMQNPQVQYQYQQIPTVQYIQQPQLPPPYGGITSIHQETKNVIQTPLSGLPPPYRGFQVRSGTSSPQRLKYSRSENNSPPTSSKEPNIIPSVSNDSRYSFSQDNSPDASNNKLTLSDNKDLTHSFPLPLPNQSPSSSIEKKVNRISTSQENLSSIPIQMSPTAMNNPTPLPIVSPSSGSSKSISNNVFTFDVIQDTPARTPSETTKIISTAGSIPITPESIPIPPLTPLNQIPQQHILGVTPSGHVIVSSTPNVAPEMYQSGQSTPIIINPNNQPVYQNVQPMVVPYHSIPQQQYVMNPQFQQQQQQQNVYQVPNQQQYYVMQQSNPQQQYIMQQSNPQQQYVQLSQPYAQYPQQYIQQYKQ